MPLLSFLLALLSFSALAGPAEENEAAEPYRPCQPLDIEGGTFRMMDFATEYAYKPTDAHFQAHQFFTFGEDGSFRHFTSDNAMNDGEVFAHLELSSPSQNQYSINDAGLVTVTYPAHTGYYFCTKITADTVREDKNGKPIYEKDDILLSEGDEKTKVVKRLRRIVPAGGGSVE